MRLPLSFAYPTVVQLARYAVVGATGVLVDLLVLTALVVLVGLSFGAGRILSFLTALTSNFLFNRRWTFGVRSGNLARQYLKYSCGAVPAGVVNWVLSSAAYESSAFFRTYYQLAASAGTIAAFVIGFVVARWFAFGSRCRCGSASESPSGTR